MVKKVMEVAWIMQVTAGLECHDVIEVIAMAAQNGKVYKTKKVLFCEFLLWYSTYYLPSCLPSFFQFLGYFSRPGHPPERKKYQVLYIKNEYN